MMVSLSSYAQKDSINNVSAYTTGNDTIKLSVSSKFYNLIAHCDAISFLGSTISTSDDSMYVNLYYDVFVVGGGLNGYCTVTDTLSIGKPPSNIKKVLVKLNSILPHNDTTYHPPDYLLWLPLNIPKYSGINKDIQLYPNPATNTLNVKAATNKIVKNISVTDISGRVVITDNTPVMNNSLYQLNTISLLEGMYFLHLTDSEGTINTMRFIKAE